METKRWIQFKVIVDSGGLIKAGELLGISGGGLSKSIRSLEDELGFNLFFRRGRELELTDLGREFYERLPEALAVIESLKSLDKRALTSSRPALRITSFEVFTTYFLADFISNYLHDESVEIRERTPGVMEDLIATGGADIGITYEPIPRKGVDFLKVAQLRMGLYGHAKTKTDICDFDKLPFAIPVTPLDGAPSGTKGLDGWPDHLFERNIRYKVEMMETAIQLCLSGKAVCFLPEFVVHYVNESMNAKNKLHRQFLPKGFKTISRDVYIILRKNEEESKIIKKLAKVLRKTCSAH